MTNGCRRVVIDVDVGTDDYLALLILLNAEKHEEIKIEGIFCTYGNTTLDNVCRNLVRLLEFVGRTDIPVYAGATKQLIPNNEINLSRGYDGFGDLHHATTPNTSIIRKEPAASALANFILNNPNEISVICVAPLTNVALAIRIYENFADSIKDIWIMGGNYTANGNVTATAEFNFYTDPEAAFIVFDSITKKEIFLLTYEPCMLPQISSEWRFNVFGAKNDPTIDLLTRAERNVKRKNKNVWYSCDAFLAMTFLYPEKIITKRSKHNVTVELHGSLTRGQIVLDRLPNEQTNVTLIEEINSELFKELLLKL